MNKEDVSCVKNFMVLIFLSVVSVILLSSIVSCAKSNQWYPADNILEETAENIIEQQLKEFTGIDTDIDLSPNHGPESRPFVSLN